MNVLDLITELRARGFHVTPDGRVLPHVAAEILGCSEGHLANLRNRANGPPFYRIGRIWYRVDALLAWIDARTETGEASPK